MLVSVSVCVPVPFWNFKLFHHVFVSCHFSSYCVLLHHFSCWLQSLLSGLESPETMGIRLRAMWNMLGALQNSSKGSAETAKGCTEYFAPARNIRHPHGISRTRTEYSAPARNIPFACEYSVRLWKSLNMIKTLAFTLKKRNLLFYWERQVS